VECDRRDRPGDHAAAVGYWRHKLLNLGLSAVAFAGADIGGFFAHASPELFARWMQLGALYPFVRASSAKGCASNEPWAWGEQVETISRRAIELRYRLLPYLYTVFEEAARSGAPSCLGTRATGRSS
jgi:alpha-glucosidase